MEAVFQAPKRRPTIYESFEAPLPVPFSEDTSKREESLVYRADVVNQHVVVKDYRHIQALYGQGYFGKGVLSKSRPVHSISQRWEYVGDKCLPVIPLSKYQEHVQWAHAALLAQGLDDEAVSQMLQKLTRSIELNVREESSDQQIISQQHAETGTFRAPSSKLSDQEEKMDGVVSEKDADAEKVESGCCEAEKPRRQGNPLYDPLAELYPEEPKQVDPSALAKVKCRKHDDWIVHCGCSLDEHQISGALLELDTTSVDPSGTAAYVLVEEDPDEEEVEDGSSSALKNCRGKLVCRIDPFNMVEYLQLSYEEAFFLVYALGCLTVHCDGEPLPILQLWGMFRLVQPNFEITYAAYHYFRSKGWVPKTGIKYGTDLLLYRKGPPFYHASYSVVVEKADETFRGAALRPFSWRSFAALSRTTGNVSKELMLCYVIVPSDEDASSPEFLKRIKVQELLVSRWISSRERTEQEEM